jgi:hypothetical protein
MAGQQLYQLIMEVPGLTGTWQQRNAQLYKALGSPMGAYKGNLQQNLYLLDQIKKKNYGTLTPAPAPQPAQPAVAAAPQQTLAQQYTNPLTGQLATAAEIPLFQQVVPFMDFWQERLQPGALQTGEQFIKPEVMRQYGETNRGYMNDMTSAGGQRFGRALGELGNIKAASSRDYNAQLQDWVGQQRQGWENLWYNPQRDIWNKGITQAKPGSVYGQDLKIPTWEENWQKYGPAYGAGESTSLF